jgi:hypothetical protein
MRLSVLKLLLFVAAAMPALLTQAKLSQADPAATWYWCETSKAYFPTVTNCLVAWREVTVSLGPAAAGLVPPPMPSETTAGPMSVSDWIVDRRLLIGKPVSVTGLASCTVGFDCFIYQPNLLKADAPFSALSLNREAKKHLLRCDLRRNRCLVTVTGRASAGEIAGVAATKIVFH